VECFLGENVVPTRRCWTNLMSRVVSVEKGPVRSGWRFVDFNIGWCAADQ
jgi:hypothetical protein